MQELEHSLSAVLLEEGKQRIDSDPDLGRLEHVGGGFEGFDRTRDGDAEVGEGIDIGRRRFDRRRNIRGGRGGTARLRVVGDNRKRLRTPVVDEV